MSDAVAFVLSLAIGFAAGFIVRELAPRRPAPKLAELRRVSFSCKNCGYNSGLELFGTLAPDVCPSCGQTEAGWRVFLENPAKTP